MTPPASDARARREAQALLEVSRALSSTLESREVLQLIVDWSVRVISEAERAVIHLLDESGQSLTPAAARHSATAAQSLNMRVGEGIAGQVLAEGQTINVPDVKADPRYLPSDHSDNMRSLLVAPVQMGDRRLGTISVESQWPGAFTADDARLLTTLGAQAGVTLHNASLYADSRRQYNEMVRLHEVSRAFDALTHPAEMYGQVARRIAECFDAEQCVLLLRAAARQRLIAQAPAYGLSDSQLSLLDLSLEDFTYYQSAEFQRGDVLISNSPPDDARLKRNMVSPLGERSLMLASLTVGERSLGVLRVANKRRGPFSEDDARLMAILTGRAAVGIENAQLYEALRETVDQLAASAVQLETANAMISDFSVRLADVLRLSFAKYRNLNSLIAEVLHAATELLGAEVAFLGRARDADKTAEFVVETVHDPAGLINAGDRWPLATASGGRAVLARQPLAISDPLLPCGLADAISAPLVIGGEVYGALVAGSRSPRAFRELDLEMTSLLAQHLAHEIWKDRSERELRALNTQLAIEREKALSASRLKTEFLANTSHELRTPLNSIIGFLQIIDTGLAESPEEERRYVRSALESSYHLLAIINDVLDIAKIEAGKMDLLLEPVSLARAFADARTLTQVQAEEKSIALQFDLPDDLWVLADRGRLQQVLVNLIGNGIKYTDEGEVRVAAERVNHAARPGTARISVNDTGIGIRPEVQPHLFEKFMQSDTLLTRRHGGTGLGLAICHKLVTMMAGEIGLHSDGPGRGARVWFTLPLAESPDQ